MDAILKELNCEDLIPAFEQNHIDLEMFLKLTEDEIHLLAPNSIGQRKKIKLKIAELNEKEKIVLFENNIQINSMPLTSSCSSVSNTSASVDSELILIQDAPDGIIFSKSVDEMADNFIISARPRLPDFDLNTLLQTSPLGNTIINYYKTNSYLDNSHRTRLVDIICKHIYTFIINYRLKENDFLILATKIVELFESEVVGTYYVPAIRKKDSRTGKSLMAKGKLVSKVYNLINLSGEGGSLRKRKRESTDECSTSANKENSTEVDFCKNEDYVWLSHNCEPWNSTVIEKWNKCYSLREPNYISCKYITIEDFFKKWPILRDLRSIVLINLDFDRHFPNKGLKFFLNWESFFNRILSTKGKNLKDEALHLLNTLESCENKDGKIALQLSLLPHLIPPTGRRILNKHSHWKFSILEAIESVILHVKNPGDIDSAILSQNKKADAKKQSLQPYLIVEGPTLIHPRCFFLVIDSLKYECESLEKAFDALFKVFHVFHAEYPVQSDYLYTLIQKCVYEIITPFDKITPSTEQFIKTYSVV